LDVVLAVGDRFARIVSPGDDYIPIRPPSEAVELDQLSRRGSNREPERELTE